MLHTGLWNKRQPSRTLLCMTNPRLLACRVLRPDGAFLCLTYGAPANRLVYFAKEDHPFRITVYVIGRPDPSKAAEAEQECRLMGPFHFEDPVQREVSLQPFPLLHMLTCGSHCSHYYDSISFPSPCTIKSMSQLRSLLTQRPSMKWLRPIPV